MLGRRMLWFLTIFQVASGNMESFRRNSFFLRLVDRTLPRDREGVVVEGSRGDVGCEEKCVTTADSVARFLGGVEGRLGEEGRNGSSEGEEMEPPTAKFSILNLLSGEDEEEEENDDGEDDGKVKYEEEEEEEEEDDDMDFFGPDEETSSDKLEGMKHESLLKQYHRQGLRIHNLVFPLLLAYKLKFFTVIPLLLGALVLLVGTTGIAGFFFALFAAALGIHVKSQQE